MTSKVRIAITAIEILNLTDEEIMYLRGSLHTSAEIESHNTPFEDGPWNEDQWATPKCINCYAPISECTCRSVTFNVEDFMEPHLESDEDRLERYSEYEDNN